MDTDPIQIAARAKAWQTRREKYGPCGHGSSYARPPSSLGRCALRLIARLHADGVLSEGQCSRALDMDRVDFRAMCDEFQAEASAWAN